MSVNAYGYSPDEMRRVGQVLVAVQEAIGGEVVKAKSAVDGLIGSGFTTAAASGAYSEQFVQLSEALRQVSDSLVPLGQFLTGYADSVVDMDTQFSGMLRG